VGIYEKEEEIFERDTLTRCLSLYLSLSLSLSVCFVFCALGENCSVNGMTGRGTGADEGVITVVGKVRELLR